jgi:hypothetical protein
VTSTTKLSSREYCDAIVEFPRSDGRLGCGDYAL